jgi:hypothetical protein
MSNKNENQNENKQETLASTTPTQTVATTTTVGTGTIASNSNMQYGWICPKCGKVNAPWKDSCNCYLNIPYTPPNTPAPTPFNPMPSWPQAPEVGDAPGWWQYGPKCGEPIPCGGSISSDDTVPQLQIYNTALSTASADSPDIAAIKAMGEVVSDNLYTPLKNLDKVFNDKLNLKATKNIN